MDTCLIKVTTDDGVIGWGEGFGLGTCATTRFAFANLVQPLAIGRDADDIGGLMSDLQRKLANSARNGPVAFALSGLDIALWDIAGKVAGQPLYRMLGGEPKERVPVYASLLRYGKADLVERNAARALEQGYRASSCTRSPSPKWRRRAAPSVPRSTLMVDTNCPWTPDEAVAMAKRIGAAQPALAGGTGMAARELRRHGAGTDRRRRRGGGRRKRLHHGGFRSAGLAAPRSTMCSRASPRSAASPR